MPYNHDHGYGQDHPHGERFEDGPRHPHGPSPSPRRGPSRGGAGGGGIPDGLLLSVLALLLGTTVLTWTATGIAGLLAHGSWPEGVSFTRTPMAVRDLAADPKDLAGAWPQVNPSQLSGYGLFWGLLIGQLLILAVLTVFAVGTVTRARAVRAARRARGDAARAAEASEPDTHVRTRTSRKPTPPGEFTEPVTASPTQPTPATAPLAARLGKPAQNHADGADSDDRDDLAATTRVQDAPGAVLVATVDPALWRATKDSRAKLGPVHLFDPGQLCDTPDRLRWSPHHGCSDRATAAARATALLAPLRPSRPIDAEMHSAAETLLRSWLHAAALDDRPFREVHRWAHAKTAPTDPVQTLRTHPKASPGVAGELEATLTGHPERRRHAMELVRRVLSPLSQLHIRNACTASRADRIALESFIDETGTLYVVGDDPELMPILNALAQSVAEHGRRMAARSSPGRLGPPLTTILQLPV
ncbi:hypothetical protein [Streptomyces sp. WMMB 322]|uniref:hypothetical protein n=1 Tax=Streptomyces sp. WMMB 322 TaxID=1286821 RepID=UPI0008237C01|nr:hypothetical protein [Streptomyces sp. WMMB 322]SCK04833.1 hypothetical protein H180DRAFT_00003 [Streptomyces sp. WMMB 322]